MDGPQYGEVPLGRLRWLVFGGRWWRVRVCVGRFLASCTRPRFVVLSFPEGCFCDELSCGTFVESLARDLSLNRAFGGRCAMPQLTVEVSWFEIFRIAMWWLSILVSFRMGQSYGSTSRPVAVVAERASSDVPKDKSDSGSSVKSGGKVPFGEDGPRTTNHSGSDVPFGDTAPPEGTSSSSSTSPRRRVYPFGNLHDEFGKGVAW